MQARVTAAGVGLGCRVIRLASGGKRRFRAGREGPEAVRCRRGQHEAVMGTGGPLGGEGEMDGDLEMERGRRKNGWGRGGVGEEGRTGGGHEGVGEEQERTDRN